MTGFRKDNPEGRIPEEGQYGRGPDGGWFGMAPGGLCANLGSHDVIEHFDGTISVFPSILITGGQGETWHGYLTAGRWKSC